MALIPALYAKSTKKDLPASYHPPQHSLSHFFSDHKNTSVTRFVSRFPFWYWTFIVLRFFSWHGRHDEAPKCTLNRRGATWNFLMRLGTHDATFYGGLKHSTTLNRFFPSFFKLGSVPKEFNSRNTKSEKMRNHFCSEDLVRLFQRAIFQFGDRSLVTWHFLPACHVVLA